MNLVDGGVVVGRRNGTIFQLLSYKGKNALSTVKFVNSSHPEDPGDVRSYHLRLQDSDFVGGK